MTTTSPWMDSRECMTYARLGSPSALTRAMAHGLPYHRIGRALRFYAPEVDAWLLSTGVPARPASEQTQGA